MQIHTKKRNILDVNQLKSLVYAQFNANMFNRQKRIKDKDVDVILEDGDESKAEEWLLDPLESEEALDGEPGYQVPNDFDSEEEHEIVNDIDFEPDNDQVVNMEGFAAKKVRAFVFAFAFCSDNDQVVNIDFVFALYI